ncbi:RNA-guided endonuclease InsQ/TnpB family protein [Actinomadura rugatobispora]|uniref:RNA-guided endonuclease InsQ/TnpB family protein n=1 Tax=Actinomadura rugatobispora TaxID=1994 RepID=A0ABW1AGM7_9ACTN|nr:RNA-guided endonuclease TnpB family protein [Actinomadura rugatobispora]
MGVKLVVRVKLLPTPEQADALTATLHACNAAANRVSATAYEHKVFSRARLQKLVYAELKASGLSAQPALHVIRKTADAYTTLHAQIDAGLLGGENSKRRRKATAKPITFRPDAAHPFDDRCLSWRYDARTVSIWTTAGRLKAIAFTGSPSHLKTLAEHRAGESDLVHQDGTWFLAATCDIPEAPLNPAPADWIGVDRGIENLATTSDGNNYQGKALKRYRRAMARARAGLQAKKAAGSRSAARRLARRSAREARHATHENHKISKQIVADAQRTGRGIAVEQLDGIRDRVRLRRHQRATLSHWSFHQLGTFLEYKARRAGVPLLHVDPAYTSQRCPTPWCGHVSRQNRPTRGTFRCVACGLAGPADDIAAVNVRQRARTAWAFVTMPGPHPPHQPTRARHGEKGDAPPARQPATPESATRCEHRASKLGRSRPRR